MIGFVVTNALRMLSIERRWTMKVFITCNPYQKLMYPKIEFEGETGQRERITPLSSLALAESEPLSKSLLPHGDWNGLLPEIVSLWQVSEVEIIFIGSKEDYKSLKVECDMYMDTNQNFSTTVIIDKALIENISPSSRREHLQLLYNEWLKITTGLKVKRFSDAWVDCCTILNDENISDVDAVTQSQEILNIEDTNILLDIENQIRDLYLLRKKYEKGMKLTFHEALERLEGLRKFSINIERAIKDNTNIAIGLMRKISPPQHTECVKTKINAETRHCMDEIHAFLSIESFMKQATTYCSKVERMWVANWQAKLQELAFVADPFLSDSIFSLYRCFPSIEIDISVKNLKSTEESIRSPYHSRNETNSFSSGYIDIFAYEDDILDAVSEHLEKVLTIWRDQLEKTVDSLNNNINEYANILEKIGRFEAIKRYLDKLWKIIPKLTSIEFINY